MNKKILVLAPFARPGGRWLDDFCDRQDWDFTKVPFHQTLTSWHERGGTTPLVEWLKYFRYARGALQQPSDCVVTCFPPLALTTAALLRFDRAPPRRLIAWSFNLGSLSNRWKGRLAGGVLDRVDKFIVHARGEIDGYARWLGLDAAKFQFVPRQCGRIEPVQRSPIEKPYIVSMGSANRDYPTLLDAVLGSGMRTVLITGRGIADRLPDRPDLIKLHGLSQNECDSILAGAEMNVVPIATVATASGQVTFTRSMRMGIATVATRSVGTVDYLRDGETGLLVPPHDAPAMRRALVSLWHDAELRIRIANAGRRHAERELSDEVVGRQLAEVIAAVSAGGA